MPEKPVWPKPKPLKPSLIARMNSEISVKAFLTSHFLILILALVYLGGIYYILNKDNYNFDLNNYKIVTRPIQSFNLILNYPEDNSVVFEKNISLSGVGAPSSTIILTVGDFQNQETLGFEADSKGNFSRVISLSLGLNKISINSFDRLGNSKTLVKTIYYSEEAI